MSWFSGVCQLEALPVECAIEPAISQLLISACEYCLPPTLDVEGGRPTSYWPCLPEDTGGFADLAIGLMYRKDLIQVCAVASLAATLITFQYSAATRPFEVGDWLVTFAEATPYTQEHSFDLYPFPFWSDIRSLPAQFRFHSKYFAAHLYGCHVSTAARESVRGRYTLRAGHDKEEVHCSSRASDYQLSERCLATRQAQPQDGVQEWLIDGRGLQHGRAVAAASGRQRAGDHPVGPEAIECPSAEAKAEFTRQRRQASSARAEKSVESAHSKYARRSAGSEAPGLGCDDPEAEWRVDFRHYHKCILVVVLERLRLAPGSVLLDWGSGCGHKLSWASHLYGLRGLGIDIVADNVQWARNHSLGSYCEVDGRFVSWLPQDYFDGVISYAALCHLQPEDQCQVVTELVEKVRPGGRLWFGWNAPEIWKDNPEQEAMWMLPAKESWEACFASASEADGRWYKAGIAITFETVEEQWLFPDDKEAIGIYLYLQPAYSLFITRLKTGQNTF